MIFGLCKSYKMFIGFLLSALSRETLFGLLGLPLLQGNEQAEMQNWGNLEKVNESLHMRT